MRLSLLVGAALAAAALAPTTAHAQPAFALGHPLEAPDADVGEVSVRVIVGSFAKPAVGVDVTLAVDGTPRVARTDSAGRAFFKELPPGAKVQAQVKDADGNPVSSDEFPVPSSGGVRVMLTTVPLDPNAMPMGGAGGAPPMAGGAGMPDPRKISGVARPEQKNAAGTLVVRVVYDDITGKVPDVPVTVVGYDADGKVNVQTVKTDADGHATFAKLDISGSTAYFAMAQLPRNNGVDRLVSAPLEMFPQVGAALLLSGEKQDSTAPPVDDQDRLDPQNPSLGPGKVEVALEGSIVQTNPVTLVEAGTHRLLGHVLPDHFPADPTDIRAAAQFTPRTDEPAGTFDLTVHGGAGSTDKPLPNITATVFAADDKDGKTPLGTATTNASGVAHFELKPGSYRTDVVVNGKQLGSPPFDLTGAGGAMSFIAQWEAVGRLRALFDDIPVNPGQVIYAELVAQDGKQYKSAPFQLLAGHGTSASVRAVPILFTFHVFTGVEDQLLAVQAQYELTNYNWQPYSGGPDGITIPAPRGFKGAQVAERDQTLAGVQAGVGFIVPRPLGPSGSTVFRVGFSLPVDNSGNAEWSQDLPFGTFESWIRMIQKPGMTVSLPKGITGETGELEGQPTFQVQHIRVEPQHSIVFSVHGLPTPPAWKVWLPRFIGVIVVLVVVGGIVFATAGTGTRKVNDPARHMRRQRLLDELVELERTGKDAKRRESVLAELEKLWDDAA